MRGSDERTGALFSYVDLESRVRKDHPLRTIRRLVNEALLALEGEFSSLYSGLGRPSIAPEKLLRAMLLQAFYSIRSERQLMERLEFDLFFRWFVGLGIDDAVWDHSSFSKNRDRLLEGDIAAKFLAAVLAQPPGLAVNLDGLKPSYQPECNTRSSSTRRRHQKHLWIRYLRLLGIAGCTAKLSLWPRSSSALISF